MIAIPSSRAFWVFMVILACSRLEAQSSDGSQKAVTSLEHALTKQLIRVEQNFPAAKLFEVSVHNVLPKQLSAGNVETGSVESSYYVGTLDTFVQASDEPSTGSAESDTLLLKRSSKPEDCKKGYPGKESQVCAQQPGGPEQVPPVIRINALGSLQVVSSKLSSLGFREDRPISLTLTTVSRLLQTIKPSQENSDVLHRLGVMNAADAVVTVSQSGRAEALTLFKADNGEYLGKYFVHEVLSPPARKPS